MKKKALLASAVALATASAMTFAPVSYKVIDQAGAASAEVVNTANKLTKIFNAMNTDATGQLKAAYDAMVADIETNAAALIDINSLTHLNAGLGALPGVNVNAVEAALVDLVETLAAEYDSEAQFTDISTTVEGKLDALKQELGEIADDITRDDLADLLKAIQVNALDQVADLSYTPNSDYAELVYDSVLETVEAEWNTASNEIVAVIKEIYGAANFENLKADVLVAKDSFKAYVQDNNKESIYAEGAAALALSYARYHLAEVAPPLNNRYTGSRVTLYPDFFGVNALPLGVLEWNASPDADIEVNTTTGNLVLTVNSYGTKTITASLKSNDLLPDRFDGVELFEQDIIVAQSSSDGGIYIPTPDLNLVSDYEEKAEAVEDKIAEYLEKHPELYNNTLVYGLKKALEEQIREALLVQAAGAVTVSNGVTTLNVTPQQMVNIYNTQLNAVLKAVEDALKASELDIDPNVALTYNIGVSSDAVVNLGKELIDSLLSKGIDAVGVKSGDASLELDLKQLDGASNLTLKKSTSTVANSRSDVYSINVKDADGNALSGFKKPYRVTLPVNGNPSDVTIAHLADGSQTLLGGHYDAASKTITFYTNLLGDFVVVEHTASFEDIADINWAKGDIQYLADKGILQGRGNGEFDPRANITRAEFTAMIIRVLSLNESTNLTFNDVSEDAWYYDAVAAAKAYGIVNGRSASTFDPGAQITREEMASIVSNALKIVLGFEAPANSDEILGKFVDGSGVAAVHRDNVALLTNEGIVQGKGNGNYDPKGNATRAEVAVIVADIFNMR